MMTLAFSNKSEKDLVRAQQTTEIIKLVQELDRLMEHHEELRPLAQHPGYLTVKKFAGPIRLVEITDTEVKGGGDFSAATIEARRTVAAAAERERRRPRRAALPR